MQSFIQQTLFPLPEEEGQGEGECFGHLLHVGEGFIVVLLTDCNIPAYVTPLALPFARLDMDQDMESVAARTFRFWLVCSTNASVVLD